MSTLPPHSNSPHISAFPSEHLTEAQLEDLLLDDANPIAAHHLQACDLCRAELDHLRTSLHSFNDLTLHWAQQQAPARVPVPSRAALRWHATPVWSALAAAIAGAAVLIGAHQHQLHLATAALTAEADTEAASVSDDNRLLLAIDQEIRLGEQTPADVSALGIAPKSPASSARNLEN